MLPDLYYEFKPFPVIAHGNSQHLLNHSLFAVKASADDVITTLIHILSSGIAMSGDVYQS